MRLPTAVTLLLALLPLPAPAQTSPDDQARRLLEDGRTYRKEGKAKQALDNFNTIVTGFPDTDSVDDALLEIGRYHVEVEGDSARAREAFEHVAQRYPQSDGAPGAYYYLGRLTLQGAPTTAALEDAMAQFARVQRLYPRSAWVPQALYGTAMVHRRAGRLAEAADAGRRVALEYPNSDAAPGAHFQVGEALALLGEPRPAMEEFQRIRNRFPASEWAPRALDRITALYRLYGGPKPAFTLDGSYAVAAGDVGKDVRALLMTPARTLWVASEKVKAAVPFGADGKIGASRPAMDPRSLALTPDGELVVAAKLAVRLGPRNIKSFTLPTENPAQKDPLDRIEAAVLTPGGSILVADGKRKRVYRFDGQDKYLGPFPDDREREISRMTLDGEGGIVLLDRDRRTVSVVDEGGRVLRTQALRGAGFDLRKPSDVAVDPFLNLYVADEDGGVHIFAPAGHLLGTITGGELRKPVAITLDPAGAVLVYDDRAQKVLRYR
ncbi:MAG TPA: tetratricopeptide repeat protein [Vicinamibacteria bacterium]|nr:tetratricopeptide repeat protein [Vicinamibacteria bacterium]